eukprot:7388012-Prymnesium_polylepis.1
MPNGQARTYNVGDDAVDLLATCLWLNVDTLQQNERCVDAVHPLVCQRLETDIAAHWPDCIHLLPKPLRGELLINSDEPVEASNGVDGQEISKEQLDQLHCCRLDDTGLLKLADK